MQTMERRTLPGDEDAEILYEDTDYIMTGFPVAGGYAVVVAGDLGKPFPPVVAGVLDEGCRSYGVFDDECVIYKLYDACPGAWKAHLCRAEV